ncbi:outer dense fiber protein 3-like protein 2 [Copidosoma floridanum]|uniref:outer dense fiber protein 3-like protein 2 n=1 Tax=Copidosoma floridanum TaxID=29053 RepID=UPI0006C94423|nr:outer dense fiber protein 3-like protein 2 [Copidosoma floridanum]
MPSKKITAEGDKKPKNKTLSCGTKSPGPKYNLRPVVGYDLHCHSKPRYPAYTIGKIQKIKVPCVGPGPNKYFPKLPKIPGYSIPRAVYKEVKSCSPGPKYTLPDFTAPAYTIVGKPKTRCPPPLSGPYDPPKYPPGPSFPFGLKGKDRKCEFNPPIRDPGDISLIKPTSPAFNLIGRPKTKTPCIGPGPAAYFPKIKECVPAYSFGLKHTECSTIPRTECDELC